ncbi:PAS domain S-box protein [bacterium]|nr:PAS domain S-box protein [bacterium]
MTENSASKHTQHHKAKARGSQTKNPFKIIFEKSSDALLILNGENGTILEANQTVESILGYESKTLPGKRFSILLSSDSRSSREDIMKKITVYGNVFVQEFRRADGSPCTMDLTVTMIPWKDNSAILVTIRDATERIRAEQEREKLIRELQEAMEKIKTLKGLVPICMHCKNIRDDEGFWQKVEIYVQEHSDAQFSHGICPSCLKKYYPEYYEEDELT